jgi:2,4-dienoyl-CoA reductase-like NADH-dependent reductase (Old Yellow Enzyme family)
MTDKGIDKLFSPITLPNGTKIKNRFLKGAMSELMAGKENKPNEALVRLYTRWAEGGTGLLLTGNIMVDRTALGEPGNVVVEDERDLPILKKWAAAGSQNGAHIWMQINHPGKQSPKTITKQPVAPSAVPIAGNYGKAFNTPRALTKKEIHQLIRRFVNTAVIAKKAGFTGVEIHGAHGYLVSQFLSPYDNQRTDEYGGSLENRMRFLVEMYQEMRSALGDDFPIALKINSTDFKADGFSANDSIVVVKKMAELGLDLIEISGGDYEHPMPISEDKVFFIDHAKKISELVDIPVAVTGGFRKEEDMAEAINHTKIAMIGLSRSLVLQPELPNLIKVGKYKPIPFPMLTTGIKKLDSQIGSYIGISYYVQQMIRISEGKEPKVHRNAWSPLLHSILLHGPAALSPKRA